VDAKKRGCLDIHQGVDLRLYSRYSGHAVRMLQGLQAYNHLSLNTVHCLLANSLAADVDAPEMANGIHCSPAKGGSPARAGSPDGQKRRSPGSKSSRFMVSSTRLPSP
jgi:hypothetical protein